MAWDLKKYSMTPDNFDGLLAHQGGVCALCGATRSDRLGRRFHVDHDHDTGGVRGLLCSACNITVGHVEALCRRAGIDVQTVGQQVADYLAGPQYSSAN